VLRDGDIHPDLANRLADEAARCAFYVLQMCIRAIDYCPPVGITFGDYLRAIVTADHDVNPDDTYGYRLAFVESFRQWGISPKGMRSMSVESLMWPTGDEAMDEAGVSIDSGEMKALVVEERDAGDYQGLTDARKRGRKFRLRPWDLDSNRYKTWEGVEENSAALWAWLAKGPGRKLEPAIGIVLDDNIKNRQTIFRSPTTPGALAVEVHSVRTALRRTARGGTVSDWWWKSPSAAGGISMRSSRPRWTKVRASHPTTAISVTRLAARCSSIRRPRRCGASSRRRETLPTAANSSACAVSSPAISSPATRSRAGALR
jgi:hypothetical protein